MTPLAEIIQAEIRRSGPVPFRWFMETALYHHEFGYYRRDRFGRAGDFYTAEQIQPVFGILIAQYIVQLHRAMGEPADFRVVELGAGRSEMAEALAAYRYEAVELDQSLPERIRGVVFSNEFFDALAVERVIFVEGEARQALVGCSNGPFEWVTGDPVTDEVRHYLERYLYQAPELESVEVNLEAMAWLERIAASLEAGYHLAIDYGYNARELVRFPQGTLMSYRAHRASSDVLASPGEQDITAHVCFSALVERGAEVGLKKIKLESLSATLMDAGRGDEFRAALAGPAERRQQLKSLLFGMGEQFRTLLQRKEEAGTK